MRGLHNTQGPMKVFKDCGAVPGALRGAALAIGNFDGVHLGHQAVVARARHVADCAGVLTFEPHPRSVFQPDVALFRLTPEALKLRLLAALGMDLTVVLPFEAALAALPAEAFVTEILVNGLGVAHVVTGADFRFGKGRAGCPELLEAMGRDLGFDVSVVAPHAGPDGVYSSTAVRERLRRGEPRAAARLLGYWWRMGGTVVGGRKRGHGLGFPTANVAVPSGFALKHGIYAVRVQTLEGRFRGAAYFGQRPSFDNGEPVIETFLFDFSGDLYGAEIEIELIEFLRGDRKFPTSEALVEQIQADCTAAQAVLADLDRDDPVLRHQLGRALAV